MGDPKEQVVLDYNGDILGTPEEAEEGIEKYKRGEMYRCLKPTPDSSLAYAVSARFLPICGGESSSCDIAQSIVVSISISPLIDENYFWGMSREEFGRIQGAYLRGEPTRIPQVLSFTREIPVSMIGFVQRAVANGGVNCEEDTQLTNGFAQRQAQINANDARNAPSSGSINPHNGQRYSKYLKGISWAGNAICANTGIPVTGQLQRASLAIPEEMVQKDPGVTRG